MKHTSVHLHPSQYQVLKEYSESTKFRDDVPEMSKSEIHREAVDFFIQHHDDVQEVVSEPKVVKYREERFKENEGWLRNQRTGFETQVQRHFKNRFENGYTPEQLEEWAENMHQRADNLWPREWGDDYTERRGEAHQFVDAQMEAAMEAAEDSEFDPLDPEEVYSNYGGVEDGQSKDNLDREAVIEDINRRMQAGASDPDALVMAVSKEWAISENVARDLFREAKRQSQSQTQQQNGRQNGHRDNYPASGGSV